MGERILNLGDAAGQLQCPFKFGPGGGQMAAGCVLVVEEGHPDRDGPQRLPRDGERDGSRFVRG
jgi:hypothetical protein